MENQFQRTEMLLGTEAIDRLKNARVAVFGVGGVGGFVAEALARAGVGRIGLVDKDEVDVTNINRQIIALHSTVGRPKVEVMKERIQDINPEAQVDIYQFFLLRDNTDEFPWEEFDYIVDAVDTVTAKIAIIEKAKELGKSVISAMGAGNKLDPTRFKVADIEKTKIDPLAKVMRRELKKRNIRGVKVVYSEEEPTKRLETPGSVAFVPSVAGLIIAGEVIKDIAL
jgi:tRNA A37 threonylcarbamoyladenosine dehydratase